MLNGFLKNLKIGAKFNILMIIVFIIGSSLSGLALSTVLNQRAETEVVSKATALIQMVESVRGYTQDHVTPILEQRLETEQRFTPEVVPSFSSREVFDRFRQLEEYKSFAYKDATLNPTNLRDKADSFETQLVNNFQNKPELQQASGFRNDSGTNLFYIARPLKIKNQSCLKCHSTPEVAPKNMIRDYGRDNGFGWQLNSIVAAKVIYVPADEIFASGQRSLSIVMGVVVGIFAIVILAINLLLKKTVIQRIKKIAKTAQRVSVGEMDATFEENSKDEIGVLAAAFNRMKTSFGLAMKFLNEQ